MPSKPKPRQKKAPKPPFTDEDFVKPLPADPDNTKSLHEMLMDDLGKPGHVVAFHLNEDDLARLNIIAKGIGPNVTLEEAVRHLIDESPLCHREST